MSASWEGRVRLADADARPGRYYVTCRSHGGKTAFLLGPFTQHTFGKDAHARALGMVQAARRLCVERFSDRDTAFATFGTAWTPLYGPEHVGLLNADLLGGAS